MIDRGFIKWQPFNSVINSKSIFNDLTKNPKMEKPTLFPEEIEIINTKIKDAYYSKSKINLTIFEHDTLHNITTYIKEIYPYSNTLKISNNKIISFNEIVAVS